MQDIRAVCFDAFGTLCRIGERHRPFETLFNRLGVDFHTGGCLAMTTNEDLVQIATRLGDVSTSEGLVAKLDKELASITLFDETVESLQALSRAGLKTWVVSNLAAPYGVPLRRLLGETVNGYSLSFEIGVMKPAAKIFAHACSRLSITPNQVLMVGDSLKADVQGAEKFGMRAIWLRRGYIGEWPQSVGTLSELVNCLLKNMDAY